MRGEGGEKGKGSQGFFQDFRQEGANVTILELRGGMYYCCIFQGFRHSTQLN